MHPLKDLAIVLKSTQFEERHRVITALTLEHGQISALAKNSVQSRRYGGTLDVFAASEWMFASKPGAELYQLTETHLRRSFEELRTDFLRLSLASTFNEIILRVAPKNEPCPDLFRLHSNALSALSLLTEPVREVPLLNGYLAKLLQWSGNQPRLHSCLACQIAFTDLDSHSELSCVIASAGWICPNCRQKETRHIREQEGILFQNTLLRVTPNAIFDFQISLNLPIRRLSSEIQASDSEHQALFRFLEALYIYHMPGFDQKPLKALRFLGLESTLQPGATNQL